MKSKLFKTNITGLSEKHKQGLKNFSNFSVEVLDEIAKWINECVEIEPVRLDGYYANERVEKLNDLCSTCKISTSEFFKFFSVCSFIHAEVFEQNDNLVDIADDLAEQELISKGDKEKFIKFFTDTQKKCTDLAKQNQKNDYESLAISTLDRINYVVDLRLVLQKPFDPTQIQIEDYQPKADNMVLCSIIEMILTDKWGIEDKVINFQVNFSQLEGLIVRLQACQKEMRMLKNYSEKQDFSKI